MLERLKAGIGTLVLGATGVGTSPNSSKWEDLQSRGYHPEVGAVIERYQRDIDSGDVHGWHRFMGEKLGREVDVRGKKVLEIGHGGGWYLAQSLRAGATHVYGVEISEIPNDKTRKAMAHFGYRDFDLFVSDGVGLDGLPVQGIDVVFSLTVFQHLAPEVMADYLRTIPGVLSGSGEVLLQTLENDRKTKVRRSPSDVLSVSYHPEDMDAAIRASGLSVAIRVPYRYSGGSDYWGMYVLKPSS